MFKLNISDDDIVFLDERKVTNLYETNTSKVLSNDVPITKYSQEPVYQSTCDLEHNENGSIEPVQQASTFHTAQKSIECILLSDNEDDDDDDDIQFMSMIYEDRELLNKIDGKAQGRGVEEDDEDLLLVRACEEVEKERARLPIIQTNSYSKKIIKKPDKNEILFDSLVNISPKSDQLLFSDKEDDKVVDDTLKKRRLSDIPFDNIDDLSVEINTYQNSIKRARQEIDSVPVNVNLIKKQLIEKTNQQSMSLIKYRKPTTSAPPTSRRTKFNELMKNAQKHQQAARERQQSSSSGIQTTLYSNGRVACTTTLTQGIRLAKQEMSARAAAASKSALESRKLHLTEKKSLVKEMSEIAVVEKPPRPPPSSSKILTPKRSTDKKLNKNDDLVNRILKQNGEARQATLKTHTNESGNKFIYEDFLFRMLKCSFDWLNEQEMQKEPPPVTLPGEISIVLDSYESFDDYYKINVPLLLVELWEEVTCSWKEIRSKLKTFKFWLNSVQKCIHSNELLELHGQMIINRNDASLGYLYEEDLLHLNLNVKINSCDTHGQPLNLFGLIKKFTKLNTNKDRINPSLNDEFKVLTGDESNKKYIHIYECVLYVRGRNYCIQPNSQIEFHQITNLSSTLRRIKALISFKNQPYSSKILKPVITDSIWWPFGKPLDNIDLRGFNEAQKVVISEAGSLALTPKNEPKFYFVQGPPGTGKSHTIVGLINTFFKLSKTLPRTLKILVCSPSNGGCDELLRRLKSALPFEKCSLIRAGRSDSIHKDCESYLLENLAKKRAIQLALDEDMKKNESARTHYENIKQTEKNLMDRIKILKSSNGDKTRIKEEQEKLDEVHKRRERFEKQLKQNSMQAKSAHKQNAFEKHAKELLIKEAHIIVSTLNYTGNALFDCLTNQVSIVIIDEAAQCIEVDCLIPLRFGCNKVVLVGDPEQLPATVKNQRAQDNGLAQSLFERIYLRFKYDDNSPIRMLYVQYRMHEDICRFPSKRFYKGKLMTDEHVTKRRSAIPLKHFLFFNLKLGVESTDRDSNSWSNEIEARFVVEMCKYLIKSNFKNIGIITPYQKQLKIIQNYLKDNGIDFIDVGTVDGFQGREKDIIIFSSVRANSKDGDKSSGIGFVSHRQRLNVALTRAKYTMYLVGNMRALSTNQDWHECIKHAKEHNCIVNIDSEHVTSNEFNAYLLKTKNHGPNPI